MNKLPKKDILIAEDDKDDVDVFELALQEIDIQYDLRHADTGDKLFILLKDRVPYILFLDINMPCKDGVACIIEIRKNRDYDTLPIIVYTSNTYHKIIEDCYRNGANLYVNKTYTFTELSTKLQKVFAIDWDDYMHYPSQNQFILS